MGIELAKTDHGRRRFPEELLFVHDSVAVRIKIDERTQADGALAGVFLLIDDGTLMVEIEGGSPERHLLPDGALDAVMTRFGKPLEPSEPLTDVEVLVLEGGRRLRHVRHLARYDVIALDYLVLDVPARDTLVALATTVSGALLHLGRAASRQRG